jgi:nitrate reductase gamma subunit
MTMDSAWAAESAVRLVVKAWHDGNKKFRTAMLAGTLFTLALLVGIVIASLFGVRETTIKISLAIVILVLLLAAFAVATYQAIADEEKQAKRIEQVEERAREHPERPQFAWDLARAKLESYLDRNLSQVRSIYRLTVLVMLIGFVVVMYGLFQATQDSAKLPVAIVAATSGVVISFIGGSFMLVFRSILAESRGYVTVLERINAVGMAVQVIAGIPDANADLKGATTASLANQLLGLYASMPASKDQGAEAA